MKEVVCQKCARYPARYYWPFVAKLDPPLLLCGYCKRALARERLRQGALVCSPCSP